MRLPIHREGWLFIATACAITVVLFLWMPLAGWLFLPVTVWVIAFFRDPERQTPQASGLLICPADGRLLPIVQAAPPAELEMGLEPRTRLSVFMNVFNVHVNRITCDGTVVTMSYRPGVSSTPRSTKPVSTTSACPSASAQTAPLVPKKT